MLIRTQALSELFYTIDTYGTFDAIEYLVDEWKDESEFDNKKFMAGMAELHADAINSVLPAGGVKSVKVIDTWSPREYNFMTDQVDLEIDVDLDELYRYLQMHNNEKEFEEYIKEQFTSRDGFWSFTPNNLKDFYEAMDGKSEEYRDKQDACVGILVGWYLSREALTESEYMDMMWEGFHELAYNCLEQFTQKTWDEYDKYKDEFKKRSDQLQLIGSAADDYPMDIEEWYRVTKEENNG